MSHQVQKLDSMMEQDQAAIRCAIAERLSALRQAQGMSMVAFAALLGVSRPTAYAIMSGKRSLEVEQLLLLSTTFNVSLDFLFGRTPPQPRNEHSQVEVMIAHELIKLMPGSLDRVIRLIPAMREQYYQASVPKARLQDKDVLNALRAVVAKEARASADTAW